MDFWSQFQMWHSADQTFLWICSDKDFGLTSSMAKDSRANFKWGIFSYFIPLQNPWSLSETIKYQMTFVIQTCQKFVVSPQNISWIRQIWPQNELSIFQYRKLTEYFFRPNSGPIRNNLNLLFSRGFRYSPQSAKCRNEKKNNFQCLSFNRWKMFEL